MPRKYELTEAEALLAFEQIKSHRAALQNWICSAVEHGDDERARKLVKDLRMYENLYKKLNVESHREIDRLGA